MRLPWISQNSHETILRLVENQVIELKRERELLLDRLAILGLGGPIFHVPVEIPEISAEEEGLDIALDEEMQKLLGLRHRPSKMAEAVTRKLFRDYGKRAAGPKVAWIPQADTIHAALDEAEELGKRQAI